jgi:hypothetical protein
MPAESSRSIFVRLPAELREWVVHEALVGRRSMSAVVVEAVDFMKSTQTYQFEDYQHAAAIERAISVAHLPKGTAIMLQTEHDHLRTHILVQRPSEADCSVLACVDGKEVVFADDFARDARSGDGE